MKNIYTIGYATKTTEMFLNCLIKHKINCVIDVRSSPYSKTFSEYNKENLKTLLAKNSISYSNFSEEFGARRTEDDVYEKTYDQNERPQLQVSFRKVHQKEKFQNGYKRILNGIQKGFNICFLCSEKKPEDCHRFIMVASYFKNDEIDIINIIDEETTQSYEETIAILEAERDKFIRKINSKHNEYNCVSLFGDSLESDFDIWFKSVFNKESEQNTALEFGNLKIGYVKGEENDD